MAFTFIVLNFVEMDSFLLTHFENENNLYQKWGNSILTFTDFPVQVLATGWLAWPIFFYIILGLPDKCEDRLQSMLQLLKCHPVAIHFQYITLHFAVYTTYIFKLRCVKHVVYKILINMYKSHTKLLPSRK